MGGGSEGKGVGGQGGGRDGWWLGGVGSEDSGLRRGQLRARCVGSCRHLREAVSWVRFKGKAEGREGGNPSYPSNR